MGATHMSHILYMLFELEKQFKLDKGSIFHYTAAKNIDKILQQDAVHLRMTHIDSFEDKLEGKIIDDYYQSALKELYNTGVISDTYYDKFRKIVSPEDDYSSFDLGRGDVYCCKTINDVYVACFSTEGQDEFMYANYAKNGYCIRFSKIELTCNDTTESFGQGIRFAFYRVQYGSEIKDCLIKLLSDLLIIHKKNETEYPLEHLFSGVKDALAFLKYISKSEKYINENEARLIVFVPQECKKVPHKYTHPYHEQINNGKRYINIQLPKNTVLGIYKSPNVNILESDHLKSKLESQGYKFI